MGRSFQRERFEGYFEAVIRDVEVVIAQTARLLLGHPPRVHLNATFVKMNEAKGS